MYKIITYFSSTLLVALVLIVVLIVVPIRPITTETGTVKAIFHFGRFVGIREAGLSFVPLLFIRIETISTRIHQDELPADPEFVDRLNDNPEPGKVKPFRVLHPGYREAVFYKPRY